MGNRVPFAPGEWYHCFSRGVDRRVTFENDDDYRRFVETMYLANATEKVHRSNVRGVESIFEMEDIGDKHVSIGAYALMPNHFHMLLYETEEGGISAFMQKLLVSYTMYFNIKNGRSGNLFVKPFRSRHIDSDEYLQHCVDYIHLNPADVFDQGFKSGLANTGKLEDALEKYPYSSLQDFMHKKRPEQKVLGKEIFDVYRERPFKEVLVSASEYYESISR